MPSKKEVLSLRSIQEACDDLRRYTSSRDDPRLLSLVDRIGRAVHITREELLASRRADKAMRFDRAVALHAHHARYIDAWTLEHPADEDNSAEYWVKKAKMACRAASEALGAKRTDGSEISQIMGLLYQKQEEEDGGSDESEQESEGQGE